MDMKAAIVLSILGELYRLSLRDLILEAVQQTTTQWDDQLVGVLDALLRYKPEA